MDFKESLEKIIAWVKTHPIPSVIAAVVLAVVIWYAIKNSSSSTSTATSEDEPLLEDGTGTNSLLDQLQNGGGAISVPPSIDSIVPQEASYNPIELIESGGSVPAAYYDSEIFAAPSYNIEAASESGLWGGGDTKGNVLVESPVSASIAALSNDKGGGAKAATKSTNLNPAQKLGKGKKFTGWIDGVYYKLGYPDAAESAQHKPGSPSASGVSLPVYQGSLTSYFGGSV